MKNTANDLKSTDKFSRRDFLAYSASSVAFLPHGLGKAIGVEKSIADSNAIRSLILIHLSGGNDGYNTLVPYTDKDYYSSRPNIALRGSDLIKVDRRYAFNSALSEIAQLYRDGMVAVFPGVGCEENLPKSHVRATKIWQTASPDEQWENSWHERLRTTTNSVSTLTIEGFDTHVNQREQQFKSLRQLSTTVSKLRRQLDNTLVFVYSEFGRSLAENSTSGTDHGSNGLCLAIGAAVKGGIYSEQNGEDSILDFRSLYDTMARGWLKSDFDHSLETLSRCDFLTT